MVVNLGGMACYNACKKKNKKKGIRNPSMAPKLAIQFGVLLKNPKEALVFILQPRSPLATMEHRTPMERSCEALH